MLERQTATEETVRSDNKELSDVVSETVDVMDNLCEDLKSKSAEELILE